MAEPGPQRVKSAARVAEILRALAAQNGGMTLAEITKALNLPRSSTYALLVDLVASHLVEEDQGAGARTYRVGIGAFEIGMGFLRQRSLTGEASAVVDRIAAHFDETAHLAILDGSEVVYVAKAESTHAMRVTSAVGTRFPAHSTGVGKVLLAHIDLAEVVRLYPSGDLPVLTERTIATRDLLVEALLAIRRDGYAFDDEESTRGLQCLAVPVLGADGRCVAALSLSVPAARMGNIDQDELRTELLRSGEVISRQLGWTGAPRH